MYYIYYLMDPRTGLPFYVGKGKGRRAYHHLENRGRQYNDYKIAKIKKIRSLGLEPYIHYPIVDIEDEQTAYYIEEVHTLLYGRKGIEENGILTNRIIGDRSPASLPEVRAKISKTRLAKKIKASDETRKKMSDIALAKGDKHHNKDPKVRAKRSKTMRAKGENHHNKTAAARKKIRDKTENKIKISVDGVVYESVTEAARITGVGKGTLFYRSGSSKFTNVFLIKDSDNKIRGKGAKPTPVIISGVIYESMDQAARSLGVSSPTIRNRINSDKWPGYQFCHVDAEVTA